MLAALYVLRPARETLGVARVENLPWMYTGTLVFTIAANPLFSLLVTHYSRRRFIPFVYRFCQLSLIVFFVLATQLLQDGLPRVAAAFFIWVSVFNLFAVSLFWGFMADIYSAEQGRRLFAFIGAGGTLGAIFGSLLTSTLAARLGTENLLLLAVGLFEVAILAVRRLVRLASIDATATAQPMAGSRVDPPSDAPPRGDRPVSTLAGTLAGIRDTVASPYLLAICVSMICYTVGSTFVYFQQAGVVKHSSIDEAARTAYFARIDMLVNAFALASQSTLSGRIITRLGIGRSLVVLPALTAFGFVGLAAWPTLALLFWFQVLRRATDFAVARPARETLFTVVTRDEKYKAKSLIDTFVYRGGDALGAWAYQGLTQLTHGGRAAAIAALPLMAVWAVLGLWLGSRQVRRADRTATVGAPIPGL